MAKSIRSKWKRKMRAIKRKKNEVKELVRLKKIVGASKQHSSNIIQDVIMSELVVGNLYTVTCHCCHILTLESWHKGRSAHSLRSLVLDEMLSPVGDYHVVYAVIVFVRLSVTCCYCTEMTKHRITQTVPYDSPGNLVF